MQTINGVELLFRQFRVEGNLLFLQHSNGDGNQCIGTLENPAPGTHLHAISGVINFGDRRVQADRQAVAKFLNDRAYSLVHEVILTGFKVCTVNGGGLAQLSSAFQRTGIGDQQRKNVFELPGMRHVVFRYVAGDAQIFVCQRAEFLGRANASTAKMAWTRNPARWRAALQIVANLSSRHVVFIFTTGKLSQRLLLLNRHGSQFHRIFIFLHGIIEDFLLLLAGFPVVDEIRKIEFGALPLEAQRVHHRGERVGGNAVKPGTSIVDGNLVIANVTDISASPYSMISLKDQD